MAHQLRNSKAYTELFVVNSEDWVRVRRLALQPKFSCDRFVSILVRNKPDETSMVVSTRQIKN